MQHSHPATIKNIEELREALPEICKRLHESPELLKLSFNNPILVAEEHLGIRLSTELSRAIRSMLKNKLRFDDAEKASNRRSGIKNIKWIQKS